VNTLRQSGIALVIVLWAVLLLTVLAGSQVLQARTYYQFAVVEVRSAKARALAEAGVQLGLHQLISGAEQPAPGPFRLAEGEIRLRIENERGKLDLNSGDGAVLQGLLTRYVEESAAESLLASIQDFKDTDDEVRESGAEAAEYRAAGLDYTPKNARFEAVVELQAVLGMTPGVYAAIAPFLTVHTRQRNVQPDLASGVLRELLAGESAEQPAAVPPEEDGDPLELPDQSGFGALGRGGGVFSIHAEGRFADQAQQIKAIVRLLGRGARVQVLEWDERPRDRAATAAAQLTQASQ
jgi:general secretion pathway protein K